MESTSVYTKEEEEHSWAKNQHKILKCGQKMTLLDGTQDAKGRKDCQKKKNNDGFSEAWFSPFTIQIKAQLSIVSRNKGNGKFQKRQGKEETHRQSVLSASETPEEERYRHA